MERLHKSEYHPFYQTYINQIDKNNLSMLENLKVSYVEAEKLFNNLNSNKYMYQYAPDKWTVKELIQHLIDTERVFNYRALRIARNDAMGLAGFEQNDYVLISDANKRSFDSLKEELFALRINSIHMYKGFDKTNLLSSGEVAGNNMSVRALGLISSGHLFHHLEVFKNKYL